MPGIDVGPVFVLDLAPPYLLLEIVIWFARADTGKLRIKISYGFWHVAGPPARRLWKREHAVPGQDERAALRRLIGPCRMQEARIGYNEITRLQRHIYAVGVVHKNRMVQIVDRLYFGAVCVG